MDLIIEGRAFYRGKLQQVCIGIDEGRIVEIKKVLAGENRIDFKDRLILPGAIDVHVHLRDPGMTQKEDFGTGTLAAAFGGVTTVFDMPNTSPPTLMAEDIVNKRETVSAKAWVDFGLFAGVDARHDPTKMNAHAVGYKIFMGSSTGSLLMTKDEDIAGALAKISSTGKVVSVHAEDDAHIVRSPEKELRDHNRNRPPHAEVSAISRLAKLHGNSRINVCHVTSREALAALTGTGFTKEATVHHMLLDDSMPLGGRGKVNPPLRSKDDRIAILDAFCKGQIDMLASDHAPHGQDEKSGDFDAAPSGVPGVETSVPIMMAMVKRGQVPLERLISAACQRPAELFRLPKGIIEVGRDADLMVIDPKRTTDIKAKNLHSKCGWTPYEGFEAIFPTAVFLRGMELVESNSLVGERKGRDVVVAGISGRS
ncbi:MAG TPA: dihydroorotase [Methanomassiliicoccales archaeon]|jgi:dihydroorotase